MGGAPLRSIEIENHTEKNIDILFSTEWSTSSGFAYTVETYLKRRISIPEDCCWIWHQIHDSKNPTDDLDNFKSPYDNTCMYSSFDPTLREIKDIEWESANMFISFDRRHDWSIRIIENEQQ